MAKLGKTWVKLDESWVVLGWFFWGKKNLKKVFHREKRGQKQGQIYPRMTRITTD
jgi:hypothetical protein